ncbi:MAG: hypothetical protein ACRDIV_21700 [Ktedonobacteraceae bacterium]
MRTLLRSKLMLTLTGLLMIAVIALPLALNAASSHAAAPAKPTFAAQGGLDCNGYSNVQKPVRPGMVCQDFAGYDAGRGYDNGHYIGHDEPTINFFSNTPGSANNMQWQVTLPKERPLPATQTFENYVTFWFGLAVCDSNSIPQKPCIPDSDKNHAPRFPGDPSTAGSAFLELQFYPPGFYPFSSRISCDKMHWCAALNIDSLECTGNFATCNNNCTEPVNFAFIQKDGVPVGPPGPGTQNNATFTPNAKTLLMNQGDTIKVTIKDTPQGMLNMVTDVTTGQSGFMVSSAANGFQNTDVNTCATTNYSFHPEYSTMRFGNDLNWGLDQANVSFDVEIGHWISGANGDGDADDAPCFPGPTLAGCTGSDVDFDGGSYIPDWPDGTPHHPTSLQLRSVLGNGIGPASAYSGSSSYTHAYSTMQFDTEVVASESGCAPATPSGCGVPAPGSTFYPFYAQSGSGANCAFTFGNDINGQTTNDFGRDLQYGTVNLQWTFFDWSSGIRPNPCTPQVN